MKLLMFDMLYTIQIGQNQEENDKLLKASNPEDTWFHLSDYSSPHLIINTDYEKLSKEQIYRIACILKKNTKYRREKYVSIDYTHRKEIRLTKTPGKVIISKHFNVICV